MESTRKLYYEDSHIMQFEAVVLECCRNGDLYEVRLDQTAFYPEGGGQPADRGLLGGQPVQHVFERGEDVIHVVGRAFGLGGQVSGEVDAAFRLDNMQQHSGEHILSGIISRRWGYDNVGFHIGSDYMTMDFNGRLDEQALLDLETEGNRAIYENFRLETEFLERGQGSSRTYRSKKALDERIRLVVIPGYDICACSGTHVKRTGEIGMIKIVSAKNYKGGTRIHALCGGRALEDYRQKLRQAVEISVLLSVKTEEVSQAVKVLDGENKRLKAQIAELALQRIEWISASVPASEGGRVLFVEGLGPDAIRLLATKLAEKARIAAVFSGDDSSGYQYAMASSGEGLRELSAEVHSALSGRGGGSNRLVQGSIASAKHQIIDYFRQSDESWAVSL